MPGIRLNLKLGADMGGIMRNKEQFVQIKVDNHDVKISVFSEGIPLLSRKIILRSMKNSERRRHKKSFWGGVK